jgi:hypothetical protein
MSGKNLSIAIIGAGMGGLAAAGSLCRAGFSNVHVYEQATRFNLSLFIGSTPSGNPTPSSEISILTFPPGALRHETMIVPAMPVGWAYLTALVTNSPTMRPSDSASFGGRKQPGSKAN